MNAIAKKRCTPLKVFLRFSLLNLALFLLLMPFLGQKGFDWVVMENNSHFESADYFLCILFSVPLLFGAVERGNLTMYVAALVLIAAQLRNSKDPFQREVALFLIAIAAGLKFYPAFMGLLYLQEKRYKEAGRLIVYGAVCVFVPFAFFGGLDGLKLLLSNLAQLAVENQYSGRIQFFKGALSFLKIHGRAADLFASASGGRDGGSLRGELVYAASHGGKPAAPRHPGNRPRR